MEMTRGWMANPKSWIVSISGLGWQTTMKGQVLEQKHSLSHTCVLHSTSQALFHPTDWIRDGVKTSG